MLPLASAALLPPATAPRRARGSPRLPVGASEARHPRGRRPREDHEAVPHAAAPARECCRCWGRRRQLVKASEDCRGEAASGERRYRPQGQALPKAAQWRHNARAMAAASCLTLRLRMCGGGRRPIRTRRPTCTLVCPPEMITGCTRCKASTHQCARAATVLCCAGPACRYGRRWTARASTLRTSRTWRRSAGWRGRPSTTRRGPARVSAQRGWGRGRVGPGARGVAVGAVKWVARAGAQGHVRRRSCPVEREQQQAPLPSGGGGAW